MRRISAFLFAALLCLFVGAVFWAGHFLTKPAPAATGIPSPELSARPLVFQSNSGVKLSAWSVSGKPGVGAVLLLHPVRSNKRVMLPRAQFLAAAGFSLLLLDLQAHGESGGERISFGYREAADVRAAVEKLRELAPGERIGVLGTSLGGASLLLSDVQPLLSAVVLESVYPTIDEAVANRLRMYLGPVGPLVTPLLLAQLGPRLGVPPQALRPIDRISLLRCPILVVHGTEDRHTTTEEARRLFAAAVAPKEFYALEGAGHVDLHAFGGAEYERHVGTFFARYLRVAGEPAFQGVREKAPRPELAR